MHRKVIWLSAIDLACRSVHRRLQKHVVYLCAEVDSSETDVQASCNPCDPSVLDDVARGCPVQGEWQKPYHLLAGIYLVDDRGRTAGREFGNLPRNGGVHNLRRSVPYIRDTHTYITIGIVSIVPRRCELQGLRL